MSNLATRVIVAIVGIPVILVVTWAGGYAFFAFILIVTLLGLREFFALAQAKGVSPQTTTGYTLGVLVTTVFVYERFRMHVASWLESIGVAVPTPSMAQLFLIVALLGVPLMFSIEVARGRPQPLANLAATLMGPLYVSLFLGSLVGVRELFTPADFPVLAHFGVTPATMTREMVATLDRWGASTVIAVFSSIWLCDSAAYFVGKAFGKRKLLERVSPGKTVAGGAAGFLAAVVAFLVARAIALPYLTVANAIICGIIVGFFGQLGDLAESLLKRDAGVKDSGVLIPGHGGVLDRFDSLMFVSPLIYFYLDFIVF